MQKYFSIFLIIYCFSCSQTKKNDIQTGLSANIGLIDKKATPETKSLYSSLKEISKDYFLYGHQDDMAYGVGWWAEEGRSDVKEVCGSYPAVFGWEIGNIGKERNIDSIRFVDLKKWIIKVYGMGGVNTISWNMNNPVSLKSAWDVTKAVYSILPGGNKHEEYKGELKTYAKFNAELVDKNGVQVPIIFRAFHENNGNWFWWGKKHCKPDEYTGLFKFTVNYLRDSLNIHNLIYVYSPDGQFDDYIERYPGDDYVDILGFDYYFRNELNDKEINLFTRKLIDLTEMANSRNKLAVLSETGYEALPDSLFHKKAFLEPIRNNKAKINLGYFLFWRNVNKKHHYAPYPGHFDTTDFINFYEDSLSLFLDDLPNLYLSKK